jgi:hypothetical protein
MKITEAQWNRLTDPVCSFCKTTMLYDPQTMGARHADATKAAVCGVLSAGLPRTVSAEDTPEAREVFAELTAAQ